jgi:hypothetical protein
MPLGAIWNTSWRALDGVRTITGRNVAGLRALGAGVDLPFPNAVAQTHQRSSML